MSLEFTVNSIGEKYKPVSDSDFHDMLWRLVDRLMSQFTVAILTPSKAFSSYNLNAVCKLYGLNNDSNATLNMFPKLECQLITGEAYNRELSNLMTTLEERIKIMPFDGTNEATKSIYVYLFLHATISIFGTSAFTICPQKTIAGVSGNGIVDFAIDSTRTQRTVGVTEVKHEDFNKGIAQNAVQLESCLVRVLLFFVSFFLSCEKK